MDLWMQRLHPAIEHFGKSGVRTEFDNLEAGFAQGFGRAACRDKFDACVREHFREGHQARFVEY